MLRLRVHATSTSRVRGNYYGMMGAGIQSIWIGIVALITIGRGGARAIKWMSTTMMSILNVKVGFSQPVEKLTLVRRVALALTRGHYCFWLQEIFGLSQRAGFYSKSYEGIHNCKSKNYMPSDMFG
jgi:hypothetical protein